ncbi:MAG: CoA ester lyase [Oscillospiraceae bacterium]|jgi:citrate lyase subunit beta/citryl-CoA lyase|nr:CoA ester lyase [Oscillospiraceae bacterium]
MRRSMLFLPANSPNMVVNGGVLGADSLIFDLEDAVSPDEKDAARDLLRSALEALDFGRCERVVRINGLDTPYWRLDLEAVIPMGPELIMLPKTGGGEDIRQLDRALTELESAHGLTPGRTGIIALLETAAGVENAFAAASASPRVKALFLGAEDLTADLRCQRTREGAEILYARSRLVCAARAAGVEVYDTPFTDVNDLEGLERDAAFAKGLGFTGKACISPAHVSTVNQMFSPSRKEIDYAREVFEAVERGRRQGKGAVSLRGKMIDAPIVARARLVLEAAAELGGEEADANV